MSQNVFGKSASDLTLPESAFIAGLIRMPSALWPWSHYDRAVERSRVVLARMREEGFITPQAEQQARATPPRILANPGLNRGASGYAQDYLRQQFKAEFEDDNPPDWKVRTTFVPAAAARGRARRHSGPGEISPGRPPGCPRGDRSADRRRTGARRWPRFPPHAVQPGDRRAPSTWLRIQAVSLRRRAGRGHVADFVHFEPERPARSGPRRMGNTQCEHRNARHVDAP